MGSAAEKLARAGLSMVTAVDAAINQATTRRMNWLFTPERPLSRVGSTDRRNTFCELLSWGLKEQGLSRPFIEPPGDRAEPGLAILGQIGATRKILAQHLLVFSLDPRCQGQRGSQK